MFGVERCQAGACWGRLKGQRLFCRTCNPLIPGDTALALYDHLCRMVEEEHPEMRMIIRNSSIHVGNLACRQRWEERQRRADAEREAHRLYGDDAEMIMKETADGQ